MTLDSEVTPAILHSVMDDLLTAVYDAGFAASGEGWNGEHPDPLTFNKSEQYLKERQQALLEVIDEWRKRRFPQ